ncbi:MAG: glycoside hydrolase family 43 protein [Dysgonomonas sp.]|nr:glycoside hydrolase family 43 protein [Dysgonomonas sp.]
MKKSVFLLSFLILSLTGFAQSKTFKITGNPIIKDKFTADPAPMVYKGRLYLYVGHDEYYEGQDIASGGKEFNITEWLCYSTKDMKTWTDHGSVLKPTDFDWGIGEAWASQVVEKDGKFYFYTTVQAGEPYNSKTVGVAVSDSPTGPFIDAIGVPLITDDMTPNGKRGWWNDIDPTTFIDDDGTPWMSWGNGTCFLVKLKPNMIELDGPIEVLDLPAFAEGPWIHKRNNLYYLTYASMSEGYEMINYATAPSMEGPWTHRGVLTEMAENSFTIHPGIIEFNKQWYLFYHNASLTIGGKAGAIGRRAVCVDYLYYDADGMMYYVEQTKEGITVPPKSKKEIKLIQNPFPEGGEFVEKMTMEKYFMEKP